MAAAVVLVCCLPAVAAAQVRVVTTTSDHTPNGCDEADCTLREAVTQDQTATEIQLPGDTYVLGSQLDQPPADDPRDR